MPRIHDFFLFTLQKLCFDLNLFNLSLQLNGFPIKETNRFLKTIQRIDEADFGSYIEAQRRTIVEYHLKHNPFYQKFAKPINLKDWNSIPIMTKCDLQQPLSQRLSEGFSKKNIFINKTSGSSGTPFIFAKDKFCHALTWSSCFNRYNWHAINLKTSKQARFYGIPLNNKGYYKERLKDFLSNRYRFNVLNLSDSEFERSLIKFKNTHFDFINGYTSSIIQFAKFLKKKNIVLKSICPSLKLCIVTSEMLFNNDKVLLEAQLGMPIINEYGAAELGLIAFENPKGQWWVSSDDLFVEILDNNNNVLPYGETGRVVITSLYNKAHPFIRYDLGDIGTLSTSSTLKRPILENLLGRTNDIITLPSGKTAVGLTFYYVTKTIIDDTGNVKEFVIEQLKLDTFKISYISENNLSEDQIRAIKTAITKYLEPNLKVLFERKKMLQREDSGKLKQFRSLLSK